MNLEPELSDRLRNEAHGLAVNTPSPRTIHRLAERRRRRRVAARGAAGVAVLACTVAGIGVIATRGSDQPTPQANQPLNSTEPPQSPAAILPAESSTPPTLSVTSSTPLSTTPAPDRWSALPANMLSPRADQLTVATDTGIFEWGGYNSTGSLSDGAYYDENQQTWRTLPSAPLATDRGDAIGVWTGTEVVVANGIFGNVKAAAFNPTTFTWRPLDDPDVDNAANAISQVAYVDGSVLLFSIVEDGVRQDQATILDLTTGDWAPVPAPPAQLRSSIDIVVAGDQAIVVGQSDEGPNKCGLLHLLVYTPSTKSWRELPAKPIEAHAAMITVWTGTELFFGGGAICETGVANGDPRTDAYLLNPTTGEWRTATDAPAGFYGADRYRDNWTGQSIAALTRTNTIVLYNPTTDTWHTSPTIEQARIINGSTNSTPVVTFNGNIIITDGGLTGVGDEGCCDQPTTNFLYTVPAGY